MSTTTPLSTYALEQRRLALNRANQIRIDRARVKDDIKAGRLTVVEVLDEPPACFQNMIVLDVLLLVPHWGRVRALSLLHQKQISPVRRVADLTERQRGQLKTGL